VTVRVVLDDASGARQLPGPGDLAGVGPGAVLLVTGPPGARDWGLWAPALGQAVLRGASIRRA
jgi:hypothetical protein